MSMDINGHIIASLSIDINVDGFYFERMTININGRRLIMFNQRQMCVFKITFSLPLILMTLNYLCVININDTLHIFVFHLHGAYMFNTC